MIITISGFSGSGKSTVATILAERLGMEAIDTGQIFRAMAKEHGMDIIQFGAYAHDRPEIDRELDDMVIRRAVESDNAILQGHFAGVVTKMKGVQAYRIWLATEPKTRAKRITEREEIPFEKALHDTLKRDAENIERLQHIYGLDLTDLSVYDTVVRTDDLDIEGVVQEVLAKLN